MRNAARVVRVMSPVLLFVGESFVIRGVGYA